MKHTVKKILAFVLCCLMILSVVACAKEELPVTPSNTDKKKPAQTTPVETDPVEEEEEAPDYWVELAKEGNANYVVVCTNKKYKAIAEELAELLWLKSNVEFAFSEKDNTSFRKIYVGTNPKDVLDDVSQLTYAGEMAIDKGGNIYITGHNIKTIESATGRFLSNIKAKYVTVDEEKGNSLIIPNTVFFLHNPVYALAEPKLLSKSVADYKVVISASADIVDRFLMEELIDGIGNDTGYLMKSGKDSSAATEYEIVFGKTTRGISQSLTDGLAKDAYAIKSEGNRIYITYENYVAASDAIAKFRTIYVTQPEGEINVTATSEASVSAMIHKADDSHIRVLSTNVMAAGHVKGIHEINEKYGVTYKDRAHIQARMILDYKPDFIGMQEMQESGNVNGYEGYQHTEFKNALAGEYAFVTYDNVPKNQYWTPIMYRTSEWNLVGYEAYECHGSDMFRVQWAVFERKSDPSVMCALINTHYSSQSTEMQWEAAEVINGLFDELKVWYGDDLMTFVTGDFNTAYKSQTFNTTTKGTTWDSSHVLTDNKNTPSSLDYVLVDKALVNVEGYRMIMNGYIYMSSDHYPVIADVSKKQ